MLTCNPHNHHLKLQYHDHHQYYYSCVTDNIRMFSCRWWAWTAELRTRTKQSYPCSSRNLNQSSWVRWQRHGHFQKYFLDVFAILYSWYCASAFYIPIYWRLLPISISMQTHISLFCTLTYYICSASLSRYLLLKVKWGPLWYESWLYYAHYF